MNFSFIQYEEGSSNFSLGKRTAEIFDQVTFNEDASRKNFKKSNTMTTKSSTKKCKIPLKRCQTQNDKKTKAKISKRKRVKVDSSKPYTFEGMQATPDQFYNKFEQLLNQNAQMNKYLFNDVKGLEKNLTKLQHISKTKHNKELQSSLYEV